MIRQAFHSLLAASVMTLALAIGGVSVAAKEESTGTVTLEPFPCQRKRPGTKLAWKCKELAISRDSRIAENALTKTDCRRMIRHHPSADADYRPGIDVHGRSVTPADAGGGTGPEKFTLNLAFDMFAAYGIAPPLPGAEGNIAIGRLAFRGNQAWFNGRALNGTDSDGFVTLCRDYYPSLR